MHTVEILDQALSLATECGIVVRQDWFGGSAAGACAFKGRRWIFLDLSLSPHEQLGQVLQALRGLPNLPRQDMSPQLQALLAARVAA